MDLGGGGHFRHMPPPLFGEMWACPNRKMNEYAFRVCPPPPPFGLYVLFTIWTGNERSFWRSTIFDHLPPCGFVNFINVW